MKIYVLFFDYITLDEIDQNSITPLMKWAWW